MTRIRRLAASTTVVTMAALAAAVLPACARAQQRPEPPAPAPAAATPATGPGGSGDQLPTGLGTLTQTDVAVRLRNDDLEMRFLPLDERVTRLLAPDAYASLHGLVQARRAPIDSIARRNGLATPGLALVSFYGQRAGVRFDPQLVTVSARGRVFRPVGIVALSPSFNSQQLELRGQASAIFVFDQDLPVTQSLLIAYGPLASSDWDSRLGILELERERVTARARQAHPAPRP